MSKVAAEIAALEKRIASVSRGCWFYKADNGKWYMDLCDREYDYEQYNADTYGPFDSEKEAIAYLHDYYSNPGGYDIDRSGDNPVPKKSRNGHPLREPR